MINYSDGEIKDILPHWLKERKDVQAISYAIKQQIDLLRQYSALTYGYAFVDGAPEYILDLMAVELNVWYYDRSYDIDVKRNLIKNAFQVAIKNGTTWAVERVLDAVYGSIGAIKEWYEYNGTPNHFRIDLDALGITSDSLKADQISTLVSLIDKVKRKTARLDSININSGLSSSLYAGHIMMEEFPVLIGCEEYREDIMFYSDENDILTNEKDELYFARKEVTG